MSTQPTSALSPAAVPEWQPDVDARLTRVGTRLALIADLFFFAAWYFAYFYLRALNNNGYWMKDVGHPSRALGASVLALALASAVLFFIGNGGQAPSATTRLMTGALALFLGLSACGVQSYQLWNLGFDVTQGGYPSVFTGLATAWLLQFAGAMLWLATVAVQAWRGGDTLARPGSAAQFANILGFLAGIEVLNFIILYLV